MKKGRIIRTGLVLGLTFSLVGGLHVSDVTSAAKTKKITISKKKLTMKKGEKKTLKLKNVTKKQSKKITWKSSKKKVATVSKKGLVTAKNTGKATITARYKKKSYTCKVTVKKAQEEETTYATKLEAFLKDKDLKCNYSDSFFSAAASKYQSELAKCSLATALLSEKTVVPSFVSGTKSDLEQLIESFGFTGFDVNEEYKVEPTTDSIGVACAYKTIGGKTVVGVFFRSIGYAAEWASNMDLGDGTDTLNHRGFELARRKVSEYVTSYVKALNVEGDITFWLAGQSRGAAIANLTAAWLSESADETGIHTNQAEIYAYCFATPRAAYAGIGADRKDLATEYPFIHNVLFDRDIVSRIPPEQFGFDIYGERRNGATGIQQDKAERLLKKLDASIFDSYKSAVDKDLGGKTPAAYVDAFVEQFATTVGGSRKSFVEEWQSACTYMMLLFFGGGVGDMEAPPTEKTTALGSMFLAGGAALIAEHYPATEYVYLCSKNT